MTITNESNAKVKWPEIKGEVKKSWEKLTDDDLEKTKGDMKAIGSLIQQKYGDAQKDFNEKLNGIFLRYDAQKNESADTAKRSFK